MMESGDIYQRITQPSTEKIDALRVGLERIEELNIRTCYPLLLRLFEAEKRGELGTTELVEILSLIESFSVRRAVCGVPTNSLNKLFLQWCKNIPSTNHANWLRKTMESGSGIRRWPNDAEFGREFKFERQYSRGATPFILRRLEGGFEHKELSIFRQSRLSTFFRKLLLMSGKLR